jgi:hypothetical protein
MRLQNDIADQFHEIVVAIVGEEILGLMAISRVMKARRVTSVCL